MRSARPARSLAGPAHLHVLNVGEGQPEGPVQARFRRGDPVTEILPTAEELGCDLVVTGSHGRTGLRRLMMGSVAESVIHSAPCPTMVAKDVPNRQVQAGSNDRSVAKGAGAITQPPDRACRTAHCDGGPDT